MTKDDALHSRSARKTRWFRYTNTASSRGAKQMLDLDDTSAGRRESRSRAETLARNRSPLGDSSPSPSPPHPRTTDPEHQPGPGTHDILLVIQQSTKQPTAIHSNPPQTHPSQSTARPMNHATWSSFNSSRPTLISHHFFEKHDSPTFPCPRRASPSPRTRSRQAYHNTTARLRVSSRATCIDQVRP